MTITERQREAYHERMAALAESLNNDSPICTACRYDRESGRLVLTIPEKGAGKRMRLFNEAHLTVTCRVHNPASGTDTVVCISRDYEPMLVIPLEDYRYTVAEEQAWLDSYKNWGAL